MYLYSTILYTANFSKRSGMDHTVLSAKKDLSWPGWLTYNGRFTHISGHPSATGRAQDSDCESMPVIDRRSTTLPSNKPVPHIPKVLFSIKQSKNTKGKQANPGPPGKQLLKRR